MGADESGGTGSSILAEWSPFDTPTEDIEPDLHVDSSLVRLPWSEAVRLGVLVLLPIAAVASLALAYVMRSPDSVEAGPDDSELQRAVIISEEDDADVIVPEENDPDVDDSPSRPVERSPLGDRSDSDQTEFAEVESPTPTAATASQDPDQNPTSAPSTVPDSTSSTTSPPASTEIGLALGGAQPGLGNSFQLNAPLQAGGLPNFDPDKNDDPGLTIQIGDGFGETDQTKVQRWRSEPGSVQAVVGRPSVAVWAAIKSFDTGKSGHLQAALYDCSASGGDCELLTDGSTQFDQSSFGNGFGQVTIDMSVTNAQLGADRSLVLALTVPDRSEDDLWVAFGTSGYPATFTVN